MSKMYVYIKCINIYKVFVAWGSIIFINVQTEFMRIGWTEKSYEISVPEVRLFDAGRDRAFKDFSMSTVLFKNKFKTEGKQLSP